MISGSVKFLLNDKILEIKNPDPNQTVLNYIRAELKKTGTKEGCSEGGCGACTVVFGELVGNKIKYSSINSCISFVPSLNGKQLLIVEDLVSKDGKLHPVQDAMVKFHGSQCGFCTPGFVMSLFSMFKNNKSYNSELITDSISGNLCRCTGYRPIIDAAKSLNKTNKNDEFSKNKNKIIRLLKKIRPKNIYIKKDNKVYFSPKNINDLKNIIKNNSNFNFLAGGTDLSLTVTKERKEIPFIIDLKEVKELDFIKLSKNYLEIGAATPLIKFEDEIKKYYPDFYSVLKRYGSVQIRNVGTIGGNIATASPIGDSLPILLSLKAEVLIESFNRRKVFKDKKTFILDVRKSFEYEVGSFKKAINPKVNHFREFPEYLNKLDKKKPVAMFCTGGIRCEKASAYLNHKGFKNVFQLKGGILNYLKKIKRNKSMWKGECFVFDNRVSVKHDLAVGTYFICGGCRNPVSPKEKRTKKYEEGVSCSKCYDLLTKAQKTRFRMRQKQINLAKRAGKKHIFQKEFK